MAETHLNDSCANSNVSSCNAALAPVKIKQEVIDPEVEKTIELLKVNIKVEPLDSAIGPKESNGHTKNKYSPEESDDDEEDSNDSDSSSGEENNEDEEKDEKKNIEPVKSSNEILTELFQVFNAAPPEELLDDKNLIAKAKKNKKEKKKKHKKHKVDGVDLSLEDCDGKHKKKKKHKHKHKDGSKDKKVKSKDKDKEKLREREKSKDKDKSKPDKKSGEVEKSNGRDLSKERHKSKEGSKNKEDDKKLLASLDKLDKISKSLNERKRHHDKEDLRSDRATKRNKLEDKNSSRLNLFYNGFDEEKHTRDKTKTKVDSKEKKTRRYSDDIQISDISLSDEESYLKEKETRSDNSKRKIHNSFYDGVKRSRSRDRERDRGHSRDRYRERDRDRDNSYRNRGFSRRYHSHYSRSRSRSRSRDLGIDKKRLLEIARKNAISMFKRGNLPGCDNLTEEVKDKVLLKMRYGGRTVEDLTEFCKKISNGENLSDLSSDEDSDVDKAGNSKAFHHPFQLKEREPIVMHIRNSKPILPIISKTQEQTKAITMQFPVSSGQQHRMTESWVPVEAKENLTPLPALPAASQSTTIFKSNVPKNALGKPLPLAHEQEPAFKAVPVPSPITDTPAEAPATSPTIVDSGDKVATENHTAVATPALDQATPSITTEANPVDPTVTTAFVPDVPVPSTNNSIFSQSNSISFDVSSIISKRLNAMRRLQENPMDSEALKMMYNSQREMTSWASSKHLPGQFTGSTGVRVLKPNELSAGPQVWARKDQLKLTKPVTGGMGMHLLQKMGWKPGEGLGREKNGSLQPLLLDVKLDKRGLVATEDCNRKGVSTKRRVGQTVAVQQGIEEKHPVCLLNELTSKRKWTPPMYTLVNENGPSHSKMFLFSVQVNGQIFTPEKSCNTKKEAKMIAARHCLQQIGILPNC